MLHALNSTAYIATDLLESTKRRAGKPIGSTTFRHPRGDGGECDLNGGLKPIRDAEGAWPTLVIEASLLGLYLPSEAI